MGNMTNEEVVSLVRKRKIIKCDRGISKADRCIKIEDINTRILQGFKGIVYNNAKKYKRFSNHEDLVQEGFVGLIKAIRKFDPSVFPNFFLYSKKWVSHSIKRAASKFDVVYNPNKMRVVYALPSENDKEMQENYTPEDVFFTKETGYKIDVALNNFSCRDKDIMKRLYGLGDYYPHTLREIGPIYNLTHERVRQIRNKTINRLKKDKVLTEIYS